MIWRAIRRLWKIARREAKLRAIRERLVSPPAPPSPEEILLMGRAWDRMMRELSAPIRESPLYHRPLTWKRRPDARPPDE